MNPAEALRHELFSTILRWSQESDITTPEVIGILELLKLDLRDMLLIR
jgi:hypothetical protein